MLTKNMKRCSFGILGIFLLLVVSPALAEKWSQHYINSLPDSAFASVEMTTDGKKVRHLPHHNQVGEVDIHHLKSALGRIHQVKWIDPANFAEAKAHLEQHYRAYKQEQAEARGLKGPVSLNKASIDELMHLPHVGKKLAMAVIEYRKTQGDFKSTTELMRVPGFKEKILKDIEDLIMVE